MAFSPIDIEKQTFNRKLRGFDPVEVKTFLTALAEDAARLIAEKNSLADERKGLFRQIEEHRQRERAIQQTLAAMRDLSDKMKEDSRKEGELILREARLKADQLLDQARSEVSRIESQISQLKIERDTFEDRLRLLIDEHQRLLIQRHQDSDWQDRLKFIRRRPAEPEQ